METFPIFFTFQGANYTGAVSRDTDEENNPFYRAKLITDTTTAEVEVIQAESSRDEIGWVDRCPDTDEPREVLNSDLIQAIGKEIEKHEEEFQ